MTQRAFENTTWQYPCAQQLSKPDLNQASLAKLFSFNWKQITHCHQSSSREQPTRFSALTGMSPRDTARLTRQSKIRMHHPSCMFKASVCESSIIPSSKFWQQVISYQRCYEWRSRASKNKSLMTWGVLLCNSRAYCLPGIQWHLGMRWKTCLLAHQTTTKRASFRHLLPLWDGQFLLFLTWHKVLKVRWSLPFSLLLTHSNGLCQQQLFDKLPKGLHPQIMYMQTEEMYPCIFSRAHIWTGSGTLLRRSP